MLMAGVVPPEDAIGAVPVTEVTGVNVTHDRSDPLVVRYLPEFPVWFGGSCLAGAVQKTLLVPAEKTTNALALEDSITVRLSVPVPTVPYPTSHSP